MKWLCLFSGILLLLAIPTGWPYNFYIILRWFIFFSSVYVAYGFYKSHLQYWLFVFGAVAFLFNPIFPVYLNKSSWIPIDFISSIIFFIAANSIKKHYKV